MNTNRIVINNMWYWIICIIIIRHNRNFLCKPRVSRMKELLLFALVRPNSFSGNLKIYLHFHHFEILSSHKCLQYFRMNDIDPCALHFSWSIKSHLCLSSFRSCVIDPWCNYLLSSDHRVPKHLNCVQYPSHTAWDKYPIMHHFET